MKPLKWSILKLLYLLLILSGANAFHIINVNKQMLYQYEGNVAVGARAPQDDEHSAPPTSGWIVRGKLTLQRHSEKVLAAALLIDDVTLNNNGEKFLQNKEMYPPYKPFKIVLTQEGTVSHLIFKESDPLWSTNFKRAIASIFQFQMQPFGAFVVDEIGIHGQCKTEYFVSNKTNYISIRKNPELKTCLPFKEAIHITRSNVPNNECEFDYQKSVIIGNEATYGMLPHADTGYFLSMAHVKGTTHIHTFESTGEAQFINSELLLNFLNETSIDNPIDIETSMSSEISGLELLPLDPNDPTGGRNPQLQEILMTSASTLLDNLAGGLEDENFKYSEPYDATVSDVIKVLSEMEYEFLKKLYKEIDIGTSYRQETIRNIFHEIIPRIGSKASVLLTRDLVVEKYTKTTTAVQLLLSMPFHIFELSHELVKECETFLTIGPDRPDVHQAAVLSFATLVYNAFVAKRINKDTFEEYVQKYFNLYLGSRYFEQKMLYMQALSNLQLGNVANYLDPIIKDPNENDDIKFRAASAMLPLAHTRSEKIYELYWPIFENQTSSLEMRVISLTLLLISNPTPARLLSIHRIIQSETDPHMINYYRSTITSISETTYPCYQPLRRLLSYMHRHLPQKPEARYWVTGNYIFDYRDSRFGIGAMLQAFLVGDRNSDLPVVAYLKFDTEALGKFTGQMAFYIKARGLPDAIFNKFLKNMTLPLNSEKIKKLLNSLNAPIIQTEPLHLELILQMEEKTILLYYLNQESFHKLTYNDIIQRISFLVLSDSHINMQTVRWPFMTKYSVPTVLGTASDVLLQTTVLTSLRGNILQHRNNDTMKSTLEIDARYSSYASCRSRSYNPFLNLDHDITREQGFLVYAPLNADFSLNMTSQCIKYSYNRPANMTSGLSFKSRSVTTTRGWITKTSTAPFEEIMFPERNYDVFQLLKYTTDDLGISFSINTNLNELNKYRSMMFKSEFMENGFSRNMIIHFLMYVFGVTQLSSIHLGNDRNFTMLVYNEELSKVDGSICRFDLLETADEIGERFNFTLMHSNNTEGSNILHKWNITMDVIFSTTKTSWFQINGKFERDSQTDNDDWKACLNLTYEPLVFTKRPHGLTGKLLFGLPNSQVECPVNASVVQFSGYAGPTDSAREFLSSPDHLLTDTDFCPKEVLKFSPIPTSKFCKRSNYENFTSIKKYDMDMQFSNMPEWFDAWSTRLDHLVSALSDKKVDTPSLKDQISVSVQTPDDDFWLKIEVNGVHWRFYHIPFLQKLDSKYDVSYVFSYDSGLKRSCSVINGMVNSFDDYLINLPETIKLKDDKNCSILLVADCSPTPEMAIFLLSNGTNQFAGIRFHIGDNYFVVHATNNTNIENTPVYMLLNDEQTPFDIRQQPYEFQSNDTKYNFRVELNEQNILVVGNTQMYSTVQYNLNNIFNYEIYGVYKKRMCGLCSKPFNRMQNYTLCN